MERRATLEGLFATMDRIQAGNPPPITEDEIQAEIDAVRAAQLRAFASAPLLAELADMLARPHLAPIIARGNSSAKQLVSAYSKLARIVPLSAIAPVVAADSPTRFGTSLTDRPHGSLPP